MKNRPLLAIGWTLAVLAGACNNTTPQEQPFDSDATFQPADLFQIKYDLLRPRDLAGNADGGNSNDKTPPSITIDSPQPGDFVGSIVTVSATISDTSGVVDETVVAVFAGDMKYSVPLKRQGDGSTTFSGRFDTAQLIKDQPKLVLPVLSVRAVDVNNNAAETSEEVVLDIVGPAASLDPPLLHAWSLSNNACSHPFDPVGKTAVNDGQTFTDQFLLTLRARVEDAGNNFGGLPYDLPARVDPNRVRLFVSPASLGPLVADTDGNGHCDEVTPALVPSQDLKVEANKAIAVPLLPIDGAGNPDFSEGGFDPVCMGSIGIPGVRMPPPALCYGVEPLTFIKSYWFNFVEPSIYSIAPFPKPPSANCMGLPFDASNKGLPLGKTICVAVVAYDKVGNHNVSSPLRICLETGAGRECKNWLPKAGECDPGCSSGLRKNDGSVIDPYPADERYYVR